MNKLWKSILESYNVTNRIMIDGVLRNSEYFQIFVVLDTYVRLM
jgi:hypothetical protein